MCVNRFSTLLVRLFLAVISLSAVQAIQAAPAEQVIGAAPEHIRRAYFERHDEHRQAKLAEAVVAQERYTAFLLALPDVIATSVSWNEDDQSVIKVYVDLIGSEAGMPATLDGIPLVVEKIGRIYALNVSCEERKDCDEPYEAVPSAIGESPTDFHPRPVPIGVSTGPSTQNIAGTLGCRASNGCHVYALTNAHVVENWGAQEPVIGDNVLQPGKFDGGNNPADKIGEVENFIPIEMSTSAYNRVDAAIALVSVSEVGVATPEDGYGEPIATVIPAPGNPDTRLTPKAGMDVMKYGRSSSLTYGYIDAINAVVNVDYGSNGVARFIGQIIITTNSGQFSQSGDSGSLIVKSGGADDRKPLGLLFASGSNITIANPIKDVMNLLDIDIDGEFVP
jgi:hypothetical protein